MAENKNESATKGPSNPAEVDEKCVFCRIVKKEVPADIVYEDDDFTVFADRKPTSDHHFLVVPRRHIRDAYALTQEHIPMVEKMTSIGKRVLQDSGGNLNDVRIGFHWPPFLLIKHLHLHVIAPVGNMSWFQRNVVFREDSRVFYTPPYMIQYLKDKK